MGTNLRCRTALERSSVFENRAVPLAVLQHGSSIGGSTGLDDRPEALGRPEERLDSGRVANDARSQRPAEEEAHRDGEKEAVTGLVEATLRR